MSALTSVGALYAANGAPCHYVVVQGFLRNDVALELFTEHGWKPLSSARVTIGAETVVSLVTSDKSVYATRPDELLRVRFPAQDQTGVDAPQTQKAGEQHDRHTPDRGTR